MKRAADKTRPDTHVVPDLPEEVILNIVQSVPALERLRSCALVSQSWYSAVALTTFEVKVELAGPEQCQQLQSWLEQFAGQVTLLELSYWTTAGEVYSPVKSRLLLPCSKLMRLEVLDLDYLPVVFHTQQGSSVSTRSRPRHSSTLPGAAVLPAHVGSLPAQAGQAGAGAFLPALRELTLRSSLIRLDSFLQLSKLTNLASLTLFDLELCTARWVKVQEPVVCKSTADVLQHLPGLESLVLRNGFVLEEPAVALAPLTALQRLQSVTLCGDAFDTAALAHLPSSLTYLDLCGYDDDDAADYDLCVSPSSLPQLPMLREVILNSLRVDPRVVSRFTGVTSLAIWRPALIVPFGEEPQDAFNAGGEYYGCQKALLEELGKLTQLQDLSLTDMNFACVPDLQLFTNLTVSSQLSSLGLSEGNENNPSGIVPLPTGALKHMFPNGKQWPCLEFLRLEVAEASVDGVEGWCVDANDIRRLASCLPVLHALILDDSAKDISTVAALTQLMPRLKDLTVGGNVFDNRAAPHVAKLTSLESLTWVSTNITSVGLQKLTALTGLLSLIVHDCPDLDERVLNVKGSHGWMNALELDTSPETPTLPSYQGRSLIPSEMRDGGRKSKATRDALRNQHSQFAPTALPELPEAVVTCILQHVPLKQRLTSCCLVCTAWAAAASSTAAHIDLQLPNEVPDEVQLKHLQSWLETFGQQVASICVSSRLPWMEGDLQLPCSKLTNLETLSVKGGVKLVLDTAQARIGTRSRSRGQARSASAAASAASSRMSPTGAAAALLPQLQHVELRDCIIPVRQVLHLVKLTGLTSLHLDATDFLPSAVSDRHVSTKQTRTVVTEALQHLRNLSELTLIGLQLPYSPADDVPLTVEGANGQDMPPGVEHLSSMQHLQALRIDAAICADGDILLRHIPTSLTALSLVETDMIPAAAQLQGATRLTRLQNFELFTAVLDPKILSCWRNLRSLHLADIALNNRTVMAAAQDGGPQAAAEAHDGSFLQELLSTIGQMTQLQHLQLSNVDGAFTEEGIQQLQFSPLTASSHLTLLQLSVSGGMPIPKFGLQQIMPQGKVLPHLRVLQLEGHRCNPLFAVAPRPDESPFDSADISSVVACCPGLADLTFAGCLAESANLQPLLSLAPTLTALRLSLCEDATIAAVLVKLTGLVSLSCRESSLTIEGLQQLTVLQGLTRLEIESYELPYDAFRDIGGFLSYELDRRGVLGWVIESDPKTLEPDTPVWQKVDELVELYMDSDYHSKQCKRQRQRRWF